LFEKEKWFEDFVEDMKDLPPEFSKTVDNHFWGLF
jgi:hypothetical protein